MCKERNSISIGLITLGLKEYSMIWNSKGHLSGAKKTVRAHLEQTQYAQLECFA